MVTMVLLAVFSLATAGWLAAFWFANDFVVPAARPVDIRSALIIFPHADDETNLAGLAWLLRRQGVALTFAVLTRGENGTPDARLDPHLRNTRNTEMEHACQRFNATLIQKDFGDGQLGAKREMLTEYLSRLLEEQKPGLVITYDLAGLYGHEDHISCSEIVTELMAKYHPSTPFWYVAPPAHLINKIFRFPTRMARDPQFYVRRSLPDMRIFTGRGVFSKIISVYGHKSQRRSFQSAMPWHLPIWLVYSLQTFEYYRRVQ